MTFYTKKFVISVKPTRIYLSYMARFCFVFCLGFFSGFFVLFFVLWGFFCGGGGVLCFVYLLIRSLVFFFCKLESLNELEEMVVPIFSALENKSVDVPFWTESPYGIEHIKVSVEI